MPTFSPHAAALIADGVYSVGRDPKVLETAIGRRNANVPADFEVSAGDGTFTGKTGLVIRSTSAMGYVALGTGSRKGEALVVTRGTAGGWDALTDMHVGYRPGPSGHLVHTGFDLAHESFQKAVTGFVRKNNPTLVHCIGHSLGGALATLNADMISEGGMAGVSLYTFGGPRVGVEGFARHLTDKLGQGNIHQVHHDADPVAMVPIFPFYHPPHPGYRQTWSYGGGLVAPGAHFMTRYIASAKSKGWVAGGVAPAPVSLGAQVEAWLSSGDEGVVAFSVTTLVMIGRAIAWILEKVRTAAAGAAFMVLQQVGTALDMTAYMLATGAHASVELAAWVGSLVRKVLRWVGTRVVDTGREMTRQFIRWALGQMYRVVVAMARRAIAGA